MITHSNLHYTILNFIIEHGFAPEVDILSELLHETEECVIEALYALEEYHGLVLHPHEPKIWVIHPFSLAPTNFLVQSKSGKWWGNCAWCSLGIAALLKEDLTITTSLGAHGERLDIEIKNDKIIQNDLLIHFPIPMKQAWDNVIYTCSLMLVFKGEKAIDHWCAKHNINKGDVQPISNIWAFSKKWYGSHLNPNWKKWTNVQAREIFDEFGLDHEVWALNDSQSRF